MLTTTRYFSSSRVPAPGANEAIGWIERQLRWEDRLAELRRPRPVGSPRPTEHRAAA